MTDKTAPDVLLMSRFAAPMVPLAKLTGNGIAPPKKTSFALVGCNGSSKGAVNYSGSPLADFSEELGAKLRYALGKYREVKTLPKVYDRCKAKVPSHKLQLVQGASVGVCIGSFIFDIWGIRVCSLLWLRVWIYELFEYSKIWIYIFQD